MKAALVLTSIRDCTEILKGYLANFAKYGHKVSVILIPDKKTPPQNIDGVSIPDVREQRMLLNSAGFPASEIPWNSDNRRNVGYLMALGDDAEMIVSVDDDNYCREDEDFIGEHERALTEGARSVEVSTTDWYNCLHQLQGSGYGYPRGYPYFARNNRHRTLGKSTARVCINEGLWMGDPDMDAIGWLTSPVKTTKLYASAVLDTDGWCPINSQNTAVTREMMGAYWFVRMDPPMDRFGDIFQGYFALKVAKHMGWTARFGTPVVEHRRNEHDYLKDAEKEIPAIVALEKLLPRLVEHKLGGSTVIEAYWSLSDFVESQGGQMYKDMARRMRLWAAACKVIG